MTQVKQRKGWRMSCDIDKAELILQTFRHFTYVTAHSSTLPLLQLRNVTAEFILQPFRHFTFVTTHSPTLPWLYLRHSSFFNPSVASPTSRHSRVHYPIFPSLHLRHNSFSNPSVALPTSQLILQPFRCFTYIAVHSPTLLSFLLCHKLFT